MISRRLGTTLILCTILGAQPLVARAETVPWKAVLTGAAEVPPNDSQGKGVADVSYDSQSKTLTWTISFSGLTGPVTAAHFHGPSAPGKTAPVLIPIAGPYQSPIKGSAVLTPEQADSLKRGVYVNLHTAAHPDGELRGELK